MKAFVLGAGLGTRLRPLTARRPKPLVPIYGKPLITLGFDHLIANGITSFVVNTHHCPDAYRQLLGSGGYAGKPVAYRHEPTLLDTGGGIKNVEPLIGDEPFVVYNGDILADFPLRPSIARHLRSGFLATLVLRSSGGPLHIEARAGRITDIRNRLGHPGDGPYLFTGITILSPEIFRHIPAETAVSIIPIYLDLLRAGIPIGADIVDDGVWLDLGTRDSYLDAHARFAPGGVRLSYEPDAWPVAVAPDAEIDPSARLLGSCCIGAGARIGPDAVLHDCVLWENAKVTANARLERCVVRDGESAGGTAAGVDF